MVHGRPLFSGSPDDRFGFLSELTASPFDTLRSRWQRATVNARVFYYLPRMLREQRLDPTRKRAIQLERLRRLLLHANENFDFYRERFALAGFDPRKLRHLEQLEEVPILEKPEYREFSRSLMDSAPGFYESQFRDTNTGSTGHPLLVVRSWDERALAIAQWLCILRLCGFKTRYSTLTVSAPHRMQRDSVLQRLGLMPRSHVSHTAPARELTAEYLRKQPDVIYGNKTMLVLMALHAEEHGVELPRPKLCITAAETLDDASKHLIERAFGVAPAEAYGATELGTFGWRLPGDSQFDFAHTTHVLELDSDAAPNGAREGHSVITSLTTRSMPLIRYRLGDRLTSHRDAGFEVIDRIWGRFNDWVILPDGSRRTFQPFWNVLRRHPGIVQFRVLQENRLGVRVLLVRDPHYTGPDIDSEVLAGLDEERAAPGLKIELEWLSRLPPDPSGKLREVVNTIDDPVQG